MNKVQNHNCFTAYTQCNTIFSGKTMATINVRVDENLKEKSNKIFDDLGIGMSSAITIFLKAVVRNNGIPFPLEIPNEETLKAFDEVDQIISGKVKAKKYKSANDLRKDLDV